jgi:soluble lytic murein transglycosylase-like protein
MFPFRPSLLSFGAAGNRESCFSIILIPLVVAVGLLLVLAASTVKNLDSPQSGSPYGPGATAEPGLLAPFFSSSVRFWGAAIQGWAAKWGLDPNLVATVMQIESCGDPAAASPAGANGLFQVMPFHFKSAENPLDPETNARRGLAYFKKSFDLAGGNIRQAFAGYNGGTALVGSDERQWPDETMNYAYWGDGIFREAQKKSSRSATLEEWLAHGGSRLCRQAAQRLNLP